MSMRGTAPLLAFLLMSAMPATAYVGPGAGLSLVGSLIGLVSVVVLAGFGVLLYPLQKLRERLRGKNSATDQDTVQKTEEDETAPPLGP